MQVYRPLQLGFTSQVLEQNRKFFFTVSLTLGINLKTGEELLDFNYLKDAFESMGEKPLPDMGMPKPNGEFLVSGQFYSPGNHPVTGGEVKVQLGKQEKRIYVFGPRTWQAGFPSEPEKIVSMPIDYAMAFGGKGYKKNPDGIGLDDNLLPCVEDPAHLIASRGDKPDPAGFSPFDSRMPQRTRYQGTYDLNYKKKYFPGFPEDHDWRFFLCSPFDQRIKGYYNGDETYSIHNMHPEFPVLNGQFPGLYARCFINGKADKAVQKEFGELPLNLDTIWLFPDKLLGLLIFRGVTEVEDDEAESVYDIICAYENRAEPQRSLQYYQDALEKRKNSDDSLLNNLNTQDLIPDGHKTAMELLMAFALDSDGESEFVNNLDAKAENIKGIIDEKIEQAVLEAENKISDIKIPNDAMEHMPEDSKQYFPGKQGKFDIKELFKEQPGSVDKDIKKFNNRLELILPGITTGDPAKLSMKDFSFKKLDEIMEASDVLAQAKETEARQLAGEEINKVKDRIKEEIKSIDKKIEDAKKPFDSKDPGKLASLEESRKKIYKTLEALDDIDLETAGTKKYPLPRVNSKEIVEHIAEAETEIDPVMMDIMHHIQAVKKMGSEDEETIEAMEKNVQKYLDQSQNLVEESFLQAEKAAKEAEKNFKEGYLMAAHFMAQGLAPHKDSSEDIKQRFFDDVANDISVAGRDWACIDLSGENLEGIDFSECFLEQVNFNGANLKGANFSKAILARAELVNGDFSGANFEKANIGAVNAVGANFSNTNLKSAKLSKGNFQNANFQNAVLEDIESLEIVIDNADFSETHMPRAAFIELEITGAKFIKADINTAAFIKCSVKNSEFSESIMDKCAFVDTNLENCNFVKASLANACFVATETGQLITKELDFQKACLTQANFQNMDMQNTLFCHADIENAFFGGTNLSKADLCNANGKNAQFRKADLTGAKLDNINLDMGSLAKANLAGASFRGANLHAVDFLRSNISNTDFSLANLDTTLIEHWRPE